MDRLFVLKGQMQQVYAKYSKYIEKAVQFVFALVTFYMINKDMGFMKIMANPVITLGLTVICTFLPAIVTVLFAAALILVHMYAVSLGMMAVTAVVFLIMFIFYLRFTPKMAVIVLVTPIAFMLKIPYAVPIACGLIGAPAYIVPVTCGTIVYFMIDYVKSSATALKSAADEGMLSQITMYIKQAFQSKEMWIMVIAFAVCVLIVYTVHRLSVDHAWKIAMVAGAAANVIVIAAGDIALNAHTSYGTLVAGNAAAIVIGLILEFMFFSVDYSRSERLQFEDDEYYDYVKAIPKIAVAAPEKTVKRINRRQETEIIDTEEIRKKAENVKRTGTSRKQAEENRRVQSKKPDAKRRTAKQPVANRRPPQAKKSKVTGNTEHLLLTQSLRRELNLDQDDKLD